VGKTVQTTQRGLALNPLGDLNLLSALFGVKVMQPSGKLQLVRWRNGRRKYPYRDVQFCITVPYRFESCLDYYLNTDSSLTVKRDLAP